MDQLETQKIRHHLDPNSGVLYLSIVDVIEMLGLSTEPRNYWKTLKNRLNKGQNKLVTKCNQLKMRASDGKMYLTDATDIDNMLLLIQHVAPGKVTEFRKIFKAIDQKVSHIAANPRPQFSELSTEENDEYKLSVDFYKEKDFLIIRAMLAGVNPEDISIIATSKNILIKGFRKQKSNTDMGYVVEELAWGKFSREIDISEEVDIDAIETNFKYGLLEIKLPIIDKSRTKIIQIK